MSEWVPTDKGPRGMAHPLGSQEMFQRIWSNTGVDLRLPLSACALRLRSDLLPCPAPPPRACACVPAAI